MQLMSDGAMYATVIEVAHGEVLYQIGVGRAFVQIRPDQMKALAERALADLKERGEA